MLGNSRTSRHRTARRGLSITLLNSPPSCRCRSHLLITSCANSLPSPRRRGDERLLRQAANLAQLGLEPHVVERGQRQVEKRLDPLLEGSKGLTKCCPLLGL